VTVTGRLQPFQPDPLHRAPVRRGERLEVYGISQASVSDLPGPVLPGFIQLVAGSPGVLTPIGVPQMDPGPYFSYAWQWLLFGTMSILAIGFFIFREFTDPRDPDPGENRDDGADPPGDSGPSSDSEPAAGSGRPTRRAARRRTKSFDRRSLYDPS
jgi:hypothetical protein